jgi:subtilisin family serine protease
MSQQPGPARAGRPRGQPDDEAARTDAARTDDNARDQIRVRPQRYLVAAVASHLMPAGASPLEAANLVEMVERDPDIHLVRTIGPGQRRGMASFPQVAVVEMTADRAATLAASPQLHIEIDQPLGYGEAWITCADPAALPLTDPVPVTFEVTDERKQPVAGAAVHVVCQQFPVQALTDSDGRVTLGVPADQVDRIDGVYVRAPDCWSVWRARPEISTSEPNPVPCTRLDPANVGTWSHRAMGFDRLPPTYLGHGVRVALVDSGVATGTAGLAERVVDGQDIRSHDSKAWTEDVLGSGTHAAGLIAVGDESATGRGLASEVELLACKVVPGGRHSDLIEALDYCLTHDVDIVELGVGSPYPSWLVAAKIEQARHAGVLCVAAVGNGGTTSFPAALPSVLGVAAVGRLGTFPADSYHATQLAGPPTPDGYFPARFSSPGPAVDVCAPGVAVVSTTPAGGLAALDGTGVAAAHVAALAALVLAHHHEFRNGYRARSAGRVDRLRQIIRASCRLIGDPARTGAGIPDAVTALGLAPTVVPTMVHPALNPLWSAMAGAGLTPPSVPGPIDVPTAAGPGPLSAPTASPLASLRTAMRAAGLAHASTTD